ncbi:hypothetical protein SHAM105786_15035 [Shewanella amazonensis]|uniref:Uncharacterized protein n=1 Tax=Shewanella amazonensis (strain ATCC BAA-1098 / SB2B) TaxID=326297 RepID=A1S1Y6_SHEAM|nr:hypothetical protein [Shewanella amazonensis]ABL98392.1 hypothetical protein Sama_0181 [Shewanella amazonensis SB2B]
MKTLIASLAALAIGLVAGAILFPQDSTSEPPLPLPTGSAQVITATTEASAHPAPTPDASLDSTSLNPKAAEADVDPTSEIAGVQQGEPASSVQGYTQSMDLREQLCEIQVTEDYCELSTATDFGALLLNKNDSVNVDAVSILLDADNFEVFSEWLGYANRGEQASQFEEALNNNLAEMTEILPSLNVDKPICSDSICTLTVRYSSDSEWDKAKDLLFRKSGLKNIFVSATVDGQRRYIAFKTNRGIVVKSNHVSSSD